MQGDQTILVTERYSGMYLVYILLFLTISNFRLVLANSHWYPCKNNSFDGATAENICNECHKKHEKGIKCEKKPCHECGEVGCRNYKPANKISLECENCEKSFTTNACLTYHKKSCMTTQDICKQCGLKFEGFHLLVY